MDGWMDGLMDGHFLIVICSFFGFIDEILFELFHQHWFELSLANIVRITAFCVLNMHIQITKYHFYLLVCVYISLAWRTANYHFVLQLRAPQEWINYLDTLKNEWINNWKEWNILWSNNTNQQPWLDKFPWTFLCRDENTWSLLWIFVLMLLQTVEDLSIKHFISDSWGEATEAWNVWMIALSEKLPSTPH